MQTLCGWVPNLSGLVCDGERIESRIETWNRLADTRSDVTFRFRLCNEDGTNRVDAIANGKLVSSIEIIDRAGLCRIVVEDNPRAHYSADMVWGQFKLMLDGGTTTVYQCTAADRLVIKGDLDEVEAIANWFVSTMEKDADFSAHVIDRKFSRTDDHESPSYITKARYSVNKLYFDAFMDFYKQRIDESNRSRLIDEMQRRVMKNEIAIDYLSQRYNRGHDVKTFWVATLAALFSFLALVATLIS